MRIAVVKIIVSIAAFSLVFFGLQRLLMPKYASVEPGGSLVREYYRSDFDHDVIFIGDCEVYANFSPVTLWEEYGFTSFIRGTPQQLVWQSYYLLQDTLRYETPGIVVFNVLSMQYNEPQSEGMNRLTLDGKRWAMPKVRAISASMTEGESWLTYIFPLFRFKDRWRDISGEDFRFFFRNPRVSVNGHRVRADVKPAGWIPAPVPLGDYRFGDKAYEYLEKMADLAEEHGITLVLVKAPSLDPPWHGQWDRQIADFAERRGLLYINLLDYVDVIGLDYSVDTFNAGLHLNASGAEKLSRFFGGVLRNNFDLPDRRGEAAAARWNDKSALYRRILTRQTAEIERYGRIKNFLAE
jgi:hypothetical protein